MFNWWDKIVGTYTEHRIMCEALKVFKEERDEYRDRLREANLKIMRLEDEVKSEHMAEGFVLVHPSTNTGTRYDTSKLGFTTCSAQIGPITSHDCRGPA